PDWAGRSGSRSRTRRCSFASPGPLTERVINPVATVSRVLVGLLMLAVVACAAHPRATTLAQGAPSEKDQRTPAQRKIDSRLLYEIYRLRGVAVQKNVPPGPTGVKIDPKGRAHVDIRAVVTAALTRKLL